MEALPYPALATDAPQEVPVSPPQTEKCALPPPKRIASLTLSTPSRRCRACTGTAFPRSCSCPALQDLAASPAACLRAAQRAGLEGRIIPIDDVSFISPLALPCIPLLKHNRSCVLTKLGEHEAEIILPEDGENPAPFRWINFRPTSPGMCFSPAPPRNSNAGLKANIFSMKNACSGACCLTICPFTSM